MTNPFTIYSFKILLAQRRNCVASLLFILYPIDMIASRLYHFWGLPPFLEFINSELINSFWFSNNFLEDMDTSFSSNSSSSIIFKKCFDIFWELVPKISATTFWLAHRVSFPIKNSASIHSVRFCIVTFQ